MSERVGDMEGSSKMHREYKTMRTDDETGEMNYMSFRTADAEPRPAAVERCSSDGGREEYDRDELTQGDERRP